MQHVEYIRGWRFACWLVVLVLLASIWQSQLLFAQQANTPDTQPDSVDFPDAISPSDVFARMNLLNRCLDQLIATREVDRPQLPPQMETGLGPLHVYQIVLACSMRVQELGDRAGVLAVPTVSAKPRLYAPRDVLLVVSLSLQGVRRVAVEYRIEDLPANEIAVVDKTPTDVFAEAVSVFLKLNALCGHYDISPSEVYAEMVRAAEDVRSVLRQSDPESRYRVDSPPSEPGRVPADVFEKCQDIRRLLNQHRAAADVTETPLANPPGDYEIRPRDVFLQTQVILAELNLLKLQTGTISSTPLAVPVKSTKTPTDVHEQASLIEYLIDQVKISGKTSGKAHE